MSDRPDGQRQGAKRRGVIRLVVAAPDGRRVLARPNGLAGWTLPRLAVDVPFDGWDEATVERAGEALGTPIVPGDRLEPDAWSATPTGRVPAAGRTWIGIDEADRLGADAAVVRAWASAQGSGHGGSAHGGEPSG